MYTGNSTALTFLTRREKTASPSAQTNSCCNSTGNVISTTECSLFFCIHQNCFVFLGSGLHQHKLQSGWVHKIFSKLFCFKKKSLKLVLFWKNPAVYNISRMWKWLYVLENWPLTKQGRGEAMLDISKCKAINWLISDPWHRMSSSTRARLLLILWEQQASEDPSLQITISSDRGDTRRASSIFRIITGLIVLQISSTKWNTCMNPLTGFWMLGISDVGILVISSQWISCMTNHYPH